MEDELTEKLKRIAAKKGWNYKKVARLIQERIENVYKWKDGTIPIGSTYCKILKKLDAFLEGEENKINEPAEKTESKVSLMVSIYLKKDAEPSSYSEHMNKPGFITGTKDQVAIIALRCQLSIAGDAQGMVPVTDNSMEPKFETGSWIAIKRLKNMKLFNSGYFYYVIDTYECCVLRKIQWENENTIKLVSLNEQQYPAIIRTLDQILAIFRVLAVITTT